MRPVSLLTDVGPGEQDVMSEVEQAILEVVQHRAPDQQVKVLAFASNLLTSTEGLRLAPRELMRLPRDIRVALVTASIAAATV